MDNFFLESKFKSIHITSKDAYGKCKKCGDNSEQWVNGIPSKKKSRGYYVYPTMKKRKRTECSKCVEKAKINALSRRIRSTKIYIKECEVCDKIYVGKASKGKFCSKKCRSDHFAYLRKKTYNLICEVCSCSFTNNKKKKYCSETCEKKSKIQPKVVKLCNTCGDYFSGTPREIYCSDKCSPWTKGPKERKCSNCNNIVISPARKCKTCKSIKKKKESKTYKKVCLACNIEFTTTYKRKLYCKPNHSPSNKELKKLRKRTERRSKIGIEKWKYISDFKKGRPEGMHLDHIIPLNHPDVCGLHNTWNFQWLSPEDNGEKSNKFDGTLDNLSWKKKTH